MYFVSATRLKLRSIFYLPGLLRANGESVKQLVITDGFVMGKELVDKGFVFWTLTMWHKDADMKSFRNSVPHRKAMQQLPKWCNEAHYAHWLQEEPILPGWDVIYERMVAEGVVSKVRHPSKHHADKSFPPIKWLKTESNYKPALK